MHFYKRCFHCLKYFVNSIIDKVLWAFQLFLFYILHSGKMLFFPVTLLDPVSRGIDNWCHAVFCQKLQHRDGGVSRHIVVIEELVAFAPKKPLFICKSSDEILWIELHDTLDNSQSLSMVLSLWWSSRTRALVFLTFLLVLDVEGRSEQGWRLSWAGVGLHLIILDF